MRKILLVLPILLLCACAREIPLKTLYLSATELRLAEGADSLLTVTLTPQNASVGVTWMSMDESVATVDQTGCVRAIYGGRTFIIAQAGSLKKGCAVTVFSRIERIEIQEGSPFELTVGKSAILHVNFYPERALNRKLVWRSSNEAVVSVSGGVITGNVVGEAIITAVSEDNPQAMASLLVKVTPKSEEPLPPASGDIEGLELDNPFDRWK